jgi:hypothetical protein
VREGAVHALLIVIERLVRFGASVHSIAHPGLFGTVAMKLAPVDLVAKQYRLLPCSSCIDSESYNASSAPGSDRKKCCRQ